MMHRQKQKGEEVVTKQVKPKRIPVAHIVRSNLNPASAVHQWPKFGKDKDDLMKYLDKLGKELATFLPEGVTKSYIQVEFIVDKDGVPVNFKILKGTTDEDLMDELITRMEKMGHWQPALLNDKPVAKKMIQTVTVEK